MLTKETREWIEKEFSGTAADAVVATLDKLILAGRLTTRQREFFEWRVGIRGGHPLRFCDVASHCKVSAGRAQSVVHHVEHLVSRYLVADGHIDLLGIETVAELSERAKNVLRHMGVTNLEQLQDVTRKSLLRAKNCGPHTVAEIETALAQRGLALSAPSNEEQLQTLFQRKKNILFRLAVEERRLRDVESAIQKCVAWHETKEETKAAYSDNSDNADTCDIAHGRAAARR